MKTYKKKNNQVEFNGKKCQKISKVTSDMDHTEKGNEKMQSDKINKQNKKT